MGLDLKVKGEQGTKWGEGMKYYFTVSVSFVSISRITAVFSYVVSIFHPSE